MLAVLLSVALIGCLAPPRAALRASAFAATARTGAEEKEELTDLDLEVLAVLTSRREAGPLVFHYRSGAFEEAALDAAVAANVEAFEQLGPLLGVEFPGRVHVFLYADAEELDRHTEAGTIAFACGTRSLHQVHDFRGMHELAHLFAQHFPSRDDAFTDGFVVEGLATGITEFESGAPLHAWCATYGKYGRLPSLWELRAAFPGGAPDGVHPYHVAGSFLRYLIERYGIETVERWYVNSLEAEAVFGRSFVGLEQDWLGMLAALDVAPEHEQVVLRRLGSKRDPLPADMRFETGRALLEGDSLADWTPERSSVWHLERGTLVGQWAGPWSRLAGASALPAEQVVRVRFRLLSGTGFRVELDRDAAADRSTEVIFTTYSSFLVAGDDFAADDQLTIQHGFWNEAVLWREGHRVRVFLNGQELFDETLAASDSGAPPRAGVLALSVEDGTVEVAALECFPR